VGLARQLAGLADRHEADTERQRDRGGDGAARMNPRASMPITLSTTVAPDASLPASASACTVATKASWSASSGVMSLKRIPGEG